MDSNAGNDKMEKSALIVFLSLAGVIYAYGLWSSFSTGHTLAGGLLIVTIILIAIIVTLVNKTKANG